MTKQRIILTIFASLAFILMFGWIAGFWTTKVTPKEKGEIDLEVFQTVAVKAHSSAQAYEFTGQIVARQQALVAARMTADVAEVLVESGDQVEPGDVMIRLEKEALSARVRQQQQALVAAQAQVNEARKNFQRTESLLEQKLLPESAYDEALAQLEMSEAHLKGMQEALSEAQTSESYAVILAPFKGVVQERRVSVGDIATPGMQLVQLYQPESLRFEAWLSESILNYIELNQPVKIQLDAIKQQFWGSITEIVPALEPASRSFKIRVTLQADSPLKPGMFGRIQIDTGHKEQILVPQESILEVGQLEMLYVIKDNKAERRLIRAGTQVELADGTLWREILTGVEVGESLVLNPKNHL